MTSLLLSIEQFLCSICLEVFSEPVSTPCGHNFCKRCISQTWDSNESCFCPLCKEVFSIRPQLKTNTLFFEMVSQWKLEEERRSKRVSKPGEVQCDVCSEPKLKAVKRLKVQEITAALELSEREAQRETQQMVKVFSDIMESVQRCLDHHTKVMEQSLSKHKERAQALIQQLQQEMCELEKSSTEAQQLSLSTDPLHFLQRCPALPPAGLKDWSSVSFEPQTCEGSAARALSELETSLSQKFNKVFTQLPPKDGLRRVQTFAVDVTLDPDTAHPDLDLSEDLKQVHDTDVRKKLPDSPQRFDYCVNVLGKQSFSSGRFYFEVQVKGKTNWDLGVAQESVNRKGKITPSSKNGFWTIVLRDKGKYKAFADPPVFLSPLRPPQKVGVFVDYGAGLVSFYDVDSADLLYSFTGCCFREKLFPFFCPCNNSAGTNSAPLIISAVDTESSTVCEGLK
uniref:E3 ubiquitin-protein ligase TRIM21-like n=1 Tax=Neogobius melanostomus TaxID=47308 RepID=A0A8C6UVK2_9GOBI